MRVRLEPQWGRDAQGWWMTVAITRSDSDSQWTSRPLRLPGDMEENAAKQEMVRQLNTFRKALS